MVLPSRGAVSIPMSMFWMISSGAPPKTSSLAAKSPWRSVLSVKRSDKPGFIQSHCSGSDHAWWENTTLERPLSGWSEAASALGGSIGRRVITVPSKLTSTQTCWTVLSSGVNKSRASRSITKSGNRLTSFWFGAVVVWVWAKWIEPVKSPFKWFTSGNSSA